MILRRQSWWLVVCACPVLMLPELIAHAGGRRFGPPPLEQVRRTDRSTPGRTVTDILHGAARAGESTTPFLTRPDIHGDTVVFTSEGDLWLASLTNGVAQRLTTHPGVETTAHFSPDGALLAFIGGYDGGADVYLMPVTGGEPKRLTYDPRVAEVQGWTPDGKNVLYTAYDAQSRQVKLKSVPARGGMPQFLPVPAAEFAALNPDGHRLAYVPVSSRWQRWFHYRGGQADDVWLTDLNTHAFKRLTDDPGVDTAPVWADGALYFVSERSGIANLYRLDTRNGKSTPVTHYTDYAIAFPASDGKKIVFQHGHRLASYNPATHQTTELTFVLPTDRIHARTHRVPIAASLGNIALGPTGKRLLIEARGQLLSVPVENGAAREVASCSGSRTQYPAWSVDGKWIAFVSDRSGEEQIWLCSSAGADVPRQLTRDHKGPLGPLIWSPDGKQIATSDRESRLLLVDTGKGVITQVAQSRYKTAYDEGLLTDYRFSPDGKWLAYAVQESFQRESLFLYDIANKRPTRLSSPEMNCFAPVFDPTGKYLCFLSDRQLDRPDALTTYFHAGIGKITRLSMITLARDTPSPFLIKDDEEGASESLQGQAGGAKPSASTAFVSPALPIVRVDLDGIADRILDVPQPAGDYSALEALDGRLLIYSEDTSPGAADPGLVGQILSYDLKRKQATQVAGHLSGYGLSADQKKLLLRSGAEISVIDTVAGPAAPGTGHVDLSSLTLVIDPGAEWRQMLYESWRIARDFFYDPNMHGVDWQAVKRKYAAQIPAIGDRSDLNRILGDMISELNIGHAFVGGGDSGDLPRSVPTGFLGADMEPVPNADFVRIKSILAGDGFDLEARSPLLTPGVNVKPGDFILAVNGHSVQRDQDIQSLLQGTVGQVITLTVNSKPTLEGGRRIHIRPMADESKARYYAWANGRREYVRRQGGENIGYVHLPTMTLAGMQEFYKHYYPSLNKDAIIFDVRDNGGGNISAMLLLQMASRPYIYFSPRYGEPWTRTDWGFVGYRVALCNEWSSSNAEEFSTAFQRLKLGPLIGARTWGGEVGSGGGHPLLDGGRLFIPNYGAWEPGENGKPGHWIIEGVGSEPDFPVEQDPAAVLVGRDPQLDRAIAYLKDQLAKHPIHRPIPPPYPNKTVKLTSSITK